MTIHPIPPVYDKNSRVLILGSFPSVKSREQGFFYGHPQNRFWRVTAAVFGEETPVTVPEKRAFLLGRGVALWDVIAACDITGSADIKIKNARPNDLGVILENARIERIFTNGNKAHELYEKFIFEKTGIADIKLPSTSPANAAFSLERLIKEWRIVNSEQWSVRF